MTSPRRVVMIVPELLFATRIVETARAAGVTLESRTTVDAEIELRRAPPDLLIVDLAAPADPIPLIKRLKLDPATGPIPIVGFYPHVDGELRRRALEAGVDLVLPRSAFTVRMRAILVGDTEKGVPAASAD